MKLPNVIHTVADVADCFLGSLLEEKQINI